MTSTPIFDALAEELLTDEEERGERAGRSFECGELDAPLSGCLPL